MAELEELEEIDLSVEFGSQWGGDSPFEPVAPNRAARRRRARGFEQAPMEPWEQELFKKLSGEPKATPAEAAAIGAQIGGVGSPGEEPPRPVIDNIVMGDRGRIQRAKTIAATLDIPFSEAYDGEASYTKMMEAKAPDLWKEAGTNLMSGVGKTYESAGKAFEYFFDAPGIADTYTKFGRQIQSAYVPTVKPPEASFWNFLNPEWYATTVAANVPFTASLVFPAILAAYAGTALGAGAVGMGMGRATIGAFGKTVLGSLFGIAGANSVMVPMEAAMEAVDAMDKAAEMGDSASEQKAAGDVVFRNNVKLLSVTNSLELLTGFIPLHHLLGPAARQVLRARKLASQPVSLAERFLASRTAGLAFKATSPTMESGEEIWQQAFVESAVEGGSIWDAIKRFSPEMKDSAMVGLLFGTGIPIAGSVIQALTERVTDTMPGRVARDYQEALEAAQARGLDPMAAKIEALDSIAETPAGKAHIEKMMGELKDLSEGKDIVPPTQEEMQSEIEKFKEEPFVMGEQAAQPDEGVDISSDEFLDAVMRGEATIGEEAEAKSQTGLVEAFTLGKDALSNSFARDALARLDSGKSLLFADKPDSLESKIEAAWLAGEVADVEDIKGIIAEHYQSAEKPAAAAPQTALQDGFALKLKDGRVISDPTARSHVELLEKYGINPDEVADDGNGYVVDGQFVQSKPAGEVDANKDKAIREALRREVESAAPSEATQPTRIISEEAYLAAVASLKEKTGGFHAGIDPTAMADLAKIGAYHIERGVTDFAAWSKMMVKSFGEAIQARLQEIWDSAQKLLTEPPAKVLGQATGQPIFYSQLARSLESAKQNTAPASDWLSVIPKLPGVKAEELDAIGIKEFLQLRGKEQVTKQELLDFTQANGVQVEEVMLGDKDNHLGRDPKFRNWQLAGGENYRELLLTLPNRTGLPIGMTRNASGQIIDAVGAVVDPDDPVLRTAGDDRANFRGPHFDEPNILAHIRFNERTDAEGKRVLFIEEIQSDWAQKGREEGFKGGDKTALVAEINAKAQEHNRIQDDILELEHRAVSRPFTPEESAQWTQLHDTNARILAELRSMDKAMRTGVPSAPFVKDTKAWVGLALKRMIRYAADNGFDRVAWTTGEQQAERYTEALRRVADRIEWEKTDKGVQIVAFREGMEVANTVERENVVSDAIGKSMADRILNDPERSGVIQGEAITISDTGMAGFYDRIVPQIANEILKNIGGGKVMEVTIGIEPTMAHGQLKVPGAGPQESTQPGFDVTPAMQQKVQQGQPLFQSELKEFFVSKEAYEAAKQTLKEMGKGLHANIDLPAAIQSWVTIGAYHIEQGLRTFAEWSKPMLADYGAAIKPYLNKIWIQAQEKVKENEALRSQVRKAEEPTVPTREVKKQVRLATGQETTERMIREDEALFAAFKKAEQASRIAYRVGTKDAQERAKADLREIVMLAKAKAEIFGFKEGFKVAEKLTRKEVVQGFKDSLKSAEETRNAVRDLIKQNLPLEERGKFLDALTSKLTKKKQVRILDRVIETQKRLENKDLDEQIVELKTYKGKISVEYQRLLKEIVGDIHAKKFSSKTVKKLEWLKQWSASHGMPSGVDQKTLDQLTALSQRQISEMTTEEKQIVIDAGNRLIEMGEIKHSFTMRYREDQRQIAVNRLIKSTKNADFKELKSNTPKAIMMLGAFDGYLRSLSPLRVAEMMDDYKAGENAKYARWLFKMVNQAEWNTRVHINAAIKEAVDAGIGTVTPEQEIRIMINLRHQEGGGERSLKRLMDKHGFEAIPDLTPQEQKLIEIIKKYASDMLVDRVAAVYEERENKPFPRLEGRILQRKYEGETRKPPNEGILQTPWRTTETAQGQNVERQENVDKDLRTDLWRIFEESVNEQVWYIHMQPAIDNVEQLVLSKEYRKHAGKIWSRHWSEYLDVITRRGWSTKADHTPFANSIKFYRGNLSKAVLGWKISSFMLQYGAVADALAYASVSPELGSGAMWGIVKEFTKSALVPGYAKAYIEQRPNLQLRKGGELAIEELTAEAGDFAKKDTWLGKAEWHYLHDGMKPLLGADIRTAAGTQQAIEKNLIRHGMPEDKAIDLAAVLMELSQSSSNVAARPLALASGEMARTMLHFQTFMLNRTGTIAHDVVMKGFVKADAKRRLRVLIAIGLYLFAFIAEDEGREVIYETINRRHLPKRSIWQQLAMSIPSGLPIVGPVFGMFSSRTSEIPLFKFFGDLAGILTAPFASTERAGWRKVVKAAEAGISLVWGRPGTSQAFDFLEGALFPEETNKGTIKPRVIKPAKVKSAK